MPTVGYFCNPFVVLNKERLGEPREECKLLGAASPLCCEKSAFITWCPSPASPADRLRQAEQLVPGAWISGGWPEWPGASCAASD